MKLLPLILFGGAGSLAAAIVNPFQELICADPSHTTASAITASSSVTTPSTFSTGWVTTSDGVVTSCNFSGTKSTIWIFPTGSGSHEAIEVTYEGTTVVTVAFIEIVIQVVDNQTSTIMPTDLDLTSNFSTSTVAKAFTSSSSTLVTPTQSATTYLVDVGADGGFIFSPNQLNASIGDTVRFNFLGKNHSVTQSDLAAPCTQNGGFDTGLNQFNPHNISGKFLVDFQVNTSVPLWFYCKQPGPPSHCGKGMLFAINPVDKFDEFLKNAGAQGRAMSTLANIGGAIGNVSSFGASAVGGALFNSSRQRKYLR